MTDTDPLTPPRTDPTLPSFQVGDDVTIRKVVSKGERLAVETDAAALKLDALLLESLSWQSDREVLRSLVGSDAPTDDPVPKNGGTVVDGTEISISNEYAHVTVSKVTTDDGPAMCVASPGRGSALNLGPQTLRALGTIDDTFAFSAWFETPVGPEDTPLEGPL